MYAPEFSTLCARISAAFAEHGYTAYSVQAQSNIGRSGHVLENITYVSIFTKYKDAALTAYPVLDFHYNPQLRTLSSLSFDGNTISGPIPDDYNSIAAAIKDFIPEQQEQ